MRKVIFAHGLESSPKGTKAIYLKDHFGAFTPPLYELGLKAQIETIEGMLRDGEPAVLVGSSLGGLTALGAAIRCPKQIAHLVLLAPAVGTGRRENAFADAEMTRPGLCSEVLEMDGLEIPSIVPATIIHGIEDDVVKTKDVLSLCVRSGSARLILVHDDHPLSQSKELILSVVGRARDDNDPLIN